VAPDWRTVARVNSEHKNLILAGLQCRAGCSDFIELA